MCLQNLFCVFSARSYKGSTRDLVFFSPTVVFRFAPARKDHLFLSLPSNQHFVDQRKRERKVRAAIMCPTLGRTHRPSYLPFFKKHFPAFCIPWRGESKFCASARQSWRVRKKQRSSFRFPYCTSFSYIGERQRESELRTAATCPTLHRAPKERPCSQQFSKLREAETKV